MKQADYHVERIIPKTLSPAQLELAYLGLLPVVTISLAEYLKRFPR